MDNKFNFNKHLQQVKGTNSKHLKLNSLNIAARKYCGSNLGLTRAHKSLQNPGAPPIPVWARKHIQAISGFQYTVFNFILGANTKFNQLTADILCGFLPMQLQIDL